MQNLRTRGGERGPPLSRPTKNWSGTPRSAPRSAIGSVSLKTRDTSHWLSNHGMICGRLSRPLYVGACDWEPLWCLEDLGWTSYLRPLRQTNYRRRARINDQFQTGSLQYIFILALKRKYLPDFPKAIGSIHVPQLSQPHSRPVSPAPVRGE